MEDTLEPESRKEGLTALVRDEAIGMGIIIGICTALTGDPLVAAAIAPDYTANGFRQVTYQVRAVLIDLYVRIRGTESSE